MFLLDTNVCIRILNDSCRPVVERFESQSPSTIRLCSVVKAELIYGARKSRRVAQVLRHLTMFWAPLQSLPFDDACAEQYGIIRAELEAAGTPIGANDLMIAATAKRHDVTLVTHNLDEFVRVPGLRVEDWEEAAT